MPPILLFLASPLGGILIAKVPELVGEIIKIAHDTGHLKPQELLDYVNSQKTWEQITPAS